MWLKFSIVTNIFALALSYNCTIQPDHFYRSIGCSPVFGEDKNCPERFDCPDFTNVDPKKCFLKGKNYDLGAVAEETGDQCLTGCRCIDNSDQESYSSFECASVECQEFFAHTPAGTVLQYKSGECCAYNYANASEITHKCSVDGKEYFEGEKMYPSGTCLVCICQKDFDSEMPLGENPHCKYVDCSYEVTSYHHLFRGCVPIPKYPGACCTIDWRCPLSIDEVIPGPRHQEAESDSNLSCKFGQLKLAVGDFLNEYKEERTKYKCICNYPPFVQCQ